MQGVADYRVIRDSSFSIQAGGDVDCRFNFDLGTAVQVCRRSILRFYYLASQNARDLSFRVRINGKSVRTINVTGNFFAIIHELVGGDVLREGINDIDVGIVAGSGSVTVSDIVIFVDREV